jgi:hypothetical protein
MATVSLLAGHYRGLQLGAIISAFVCLIMHDVISGIDKFLYHLPV